MVIFGQSSKHCGGLLLRLDDIISIKPEPIYDRKPDDRDNVKDFVAHVVMKGENPHAHDNLQINDEYVYIGERFQTLEECELWIWEKVIPFFRPLNYPFWDNRT